MGNEAVDQLTKFDRALRDFSAASGVQERGIDGMVVTKWDTVDDKVRLLRALRTNDERMRASFIGCWPFRLEHPLTGVTQVGAALSMTYVTGQPIIFVGCGQVCYNLSPLCSSLELRLCGLLIDVH